MCHCECIALYEASSLQEDQLWAASLASGSIMSEESGHQWYIWATWSTVTWAGGDLLQNSSGGKNSMQFASAFPSIWAMCANSERCHDLQVDSGEKRMLFSYAANVISDKIILWNTEDPVIDCRHHWSSASFCMHAYLCRLIRFNASSDRKRLRCATTTAAATVWIRTVELGDHAFTIATMLVWNSFPPLFQLVN